MHRGKYELTKLRQGLDGPDVRITGVDFIPVGIYDSIRSGKPIFFRLISLIVLVSKGNGI